MTIISFVSVISFYNEIGSLKVPIYSVWRLEILVITWLSLLATPLRIVSSFEIIVQVVASDILIEYYIYVPLCVVE